MRGAISKKAGSAVPRWPEGSGKYGGRHKTGHEGESWTKAKTDLKATACCTSEGRVSINEMESEGHEEKYRAVIDGETQG